MNHQPLDFYTSTPPVKRVGRKYKYGFPIYTKGKVLASYVAFYSAKNRCKSNHPSHANYFDRGIRMDFPSYLAWLKAVGEKPSPAMTIDRIDGSKGYGIYGGVLNVRWASRQVQRQNQRDFVNVSRLMDGVLAALGFGVRYGKVKICPVKKVRIRKSRPRGQR
jgi:hypothetical protein